MLCALVYVTSNTQPLTCAACHRYAQGCGIVVFDSMTSAVAAMEALHNKHHWTGGETTMVVEWADPSRHRKESANAKGKAAHGMQRSPSCSWPYFA